MSIGQEIIEICKANLIAIKDSGLQSIELDSLAELHPNLLAVWPLICKMTRNKSLSWLLAEGLAEGLEMAKPQPLRQNEPSWMDVLHNWQIVLLGIGYEDVAQAIADLGRVGEGASISVVVDEIQYDWGLVNHALPNGVYEVELCTLETIASDEAHFVTHIHPSGIIKVMALDINKLMINTKEDLTRLLHPYKSGCFTSGLRRPGSIWYRPNEINSE